ncbi:MAG: hypothetical protein JWM86_1948 [Thermoleophilia bacterium]|nr:hypothetical protein [Thermoleophilia bacterium]
MTFALRMTLLSTMLLLAFAASASAAATQIAPAVGARLTTPYPVFRWSVPEGEQNLQLTVTPTAAIVDGGLDDSNGMVGSPAAGATAYVDRTKVFTPGDYFWQIRTDNNSAVSEEFQIFRTPAQRFIVPGIFQFSFLKPVIGTNGANNLSQVQLTGVLRCNMASGTTSSIMRVYRGTRLIHTDTRVVGCFGMTKNSLYHNFQPRPGSIPNGTMLKVTMSAKSGIYKTLVPSVKLIKWHS